MERSITNGDQLTGLEPCVVLAGGEGRRVQEATQGIIPKPMLNVAGLPFIYHKLNSMRFQGFRDVFILTGHQAQRINEYISNLKLSGLTIHLLSDGPTLLGTGGGIRNHLSTLPETFWVTYADSITACDISLEFLHHVSRNNGIMTVRNNSSGHEPGNVALSTDCKWITAYAKYQRPNSLPWIDFGLLRLNRAHFSTLPKGSFDLSLVLQSLIDSRTLRALITEKEYFDIGTLDSYIRTCQLAEVSGNSEWWNPR